MQTQVKSSGGITLVPLETRQLAMRRIAVTKPIDMELACAFSDQVMLLCDDTVRESIDILFACPGGEIQAGMLMYDVIQSCPAPMRMFCRGRLPVWRRCCSPAEITDATSCPTAN